MQFIEALRQRQAREREINARRSHGLIQDEPGYPDTRGPPPQMPMMFGRVDCHPTIANQSSGNKFPDANHGLQDTLAFFNRTFGFTARESVAIMGKYIDHQPMVIVVFKCNGKKNR